jgi:hypothetical protein
VIELPDVGQRAKGDVEGAVGPLADLPRLPQHIAHLGGDSDGLHTGGGVDANDVARRTPGAHQRFQAFELREDRLERRTRSRLVRRPALRCSSDPIATPTRSTTRICPDASDEVARQAIDAAISMPTAAKAHARATARIEPLGYTGIMSVR